MSAAERVAQREGIIMRRLLAIIRAARLANTPTPERQLELERERAAAVRGIPSTVFVRIL